MARTAGRTQLKNKLSNETKSFLIAVKQNMKPEHSCAGPLSCNATSPQLRWITEMCCHCCGLIIGMEVLTGGSLLRAARETLGGLLSGFCLLATVDLRLVLWSLSPCSHGSLSLHCVDAPALLCVRTADLAVIRGSRVSSIPRQSTPDSILSSSLFELAP